MGISRYLAMTAAEMAAFSLPEGCFAAYMACHFSPYGTGLSNIPDCLPPQAMLILNDRTPICGHDPRRIALQLSQAVQQLACSCVLLDFQRPEQPETQALCRVLAEEFPCPVGISDLYARDLESPVFLPPAPLDQPLQVHLAPWEGREIWLDTAPDAARIRITESGSSITPLPFSRPPENAFEDTSLHCLYRAAVTQQEIVFQLWRDRQQLQSLAEEAQALGVCKCIGLFQQFCAETDFHGRFAPSE